MIRDLDARDRDRCMDLAARVGWPREPAKWDLMFALGRGYGSMGDDDALSAMVVIPAFEGASFVAMMVVDPRFQRRGLGRALLEHAMANATPSLMLYATPAGRPLYEVLGFREVDGASKHIGTPRATRRPSGVVNATPSDHASIIDADAHAYGVRRSRLLTLLFERAERVVVDARGGFGIRWWNGAIAVVGPVVAADEDAAIALVDGALEGCSSAARVDVPVRSPKLDAHASALGLAKLDTAPLMTWPRAFVPGERRRYHALALQAFG